MMFFFRVVFLCMLFFFHQVFYSQDVIQSDANTILIAHNKPISFAEFHPYNFNLFITSSYDGSIKIWNLKDKVSLLSSFQSHDNAPISASSFSFDGRYFYYATTSKTFYKVDVKTFSNVEKSFYTNNTLTKILTLKGTNDFIVTLSSDGIVRLMSLFLQKDVQEINPKNVFVKDLQLSADNKYILLLDSLKHLYVIDMFNFRIESHPKLLSKSIEYFEYLSDKHKIYCITEDNILYDYDIIGEKLTKLLEGKEKKLATLKVSPSKEYILLSTYTKELLLYALNSNTIIDNFGNYFGILQHVLFSPDGDLVFTSEGMRSLHKVVIRKSPITHCEECKLLTLLNTKIIEKYSFYLSKDEFEKKEDFKKKLMDFQEHFQEHFQEVAVEVLTEDFNNKKTIIGYYDIENESFELKKEGYLPFYVKTKNSRAKKFKEKADIFKYSNIHFNLTNKGIEIKEAEMKVGNKKYKVGTKVAQYNALKYADIFPMLSSESLIEFSPSSTSANSTIRKSTLSFNAFSDVDFDIPKGLKKRPHGIAIIIGSSQYKYLSRVPYAIQDARTMKEYIHKTFGFLQENIFLIEDATKADFELFFGTKGNHKGKLYNLISSPETEIFIFYSGHGAPGLKTQKSYFIPVECNPNYVDIQGYALDVFYENLSHLKTQFITIVLDACYSGVNVYKNISSSGIVKRKDPIYLLNNGLVFAASREDQVAGWYPKKNHGLFTYFFLKALQEYKKNDKDNDGKLTAREIFLSLKDKDLGIPFYARTLNEKEQEPTLKGTNIDKVLMEY